ncbi:hypothetical protein [Pseudodesulfovibrio pelocollis]|uniref:hypothetical protein n=1 Tax=Pseudodesulfovibrio pelocollis TaxID=3051432 RepID=UPI00255AF06F|nr:hypothetical protein [Pseudodesulfovibrio sp. SB368]
MNRFLIPLLFVVHYAIFVYLLLLMTLDDSQFKVAVIYFTISTGVYALSCFELGQAKLAVIFWYIFVAFNLLSYLNILIRGVFFMIAAALVATLIARIVQNIYQRPSLPLPQATLQRIALALWIGALGLAASSASSWTAWNAPDSLRFAIPGLLALLLTPAMRTVHKWLTPAQLALLILLGVCHGLPGLADFDIIEATTLTALCVTAAAFCTLGWAYVRFLKGERGARDPAA